MPSQTSLLAQAAGTPLGGTIGGAGLGPFGTIGQGLGADVASGTKGLVAVTNVISSIIGFMTIAAAIWFILQFLVGGFYWMSSGGDKAKLHEARERITNALIGLLIVVGGWSILALTGQFLGYDIVIGQPGKVIEQLGIH